MSVLRAIIQDATFKTQHRLAALDTREKCVECFRLILDAGTRIVQHHDRLLGNVRAWLNYHLVAVV